MPLDGTVKVMQSSFMALPKDRWKNDPIHDGVGLLEVHSHEAASLKMGERIVLVLFFSFPSFLQKKRCKISAVC